MNNVILKGREDRLTIKLNDKVDFKTLSVSLEKKLELAGKFFSKGDMAIEFIGRKLSMDEEDILLEKIQKSGINVSCILSGDKQKESVYLKSNLIENGVTKFHKGSLRSGSSVKFNGNIIIIGDVNPGAKVEAEGNIVVLGYLNGTAHAGTKGEEGSFITALKMNPIQLRIGSKIARSPNYDMLSTNRINKKGSLEIVYIRNNEMVIEELNRETLNNMIKL